VLYTKVANQWPLYYKDDTHLSVAGMALYWKNYGHYRTWRLP
jgi:hypothetical protein